MTGNSLFAVFLDGYPWWLALLTPDVLRVLLIGLGALFVVVAIFGAVLYVRFRRSPILRRGLLVIQTHYLEPGPERELARLRLRLQSALLGAQRALALARADGDPGGDLTSLVKRSERLALPLDRQLQILQSEPDDEIVGRALTRARPRVEQFEAVARQIRRAASAELEGLMASDLEQLKADADRELTAMQAGVDELASVTAGTRHDSSKFPDFRGEPK